MRLLKFSKEDLIVDIENQNERLASFSKSSSLMRAYGMHETAYEIWVFFEPTEKEELAFFQQVDKSDEQEFQALVKSYWQGSQLLIGTASLDEFVNLSLVRKVYA